MLKTDEHVIVPFTLRSFLLFVLASILATAPLWWQYVRTPGRAHRPIVSTGHGR